MAEEEVVYSKEDGIGIITLNRPEKLNALAFEQQQRLGSLVEEVKRDEDVRVVILTGAGRAFCAGADISGGDLPSVKQAGSFRDRGINDAKKRTSTYDPGTLWSINSIAKPTICAINGAAVGMGAEYTLLCDIRIASETARWGQVFVLRGVVPDHGAGTYLLPRIVGLSKACELVFSGKIIDAEEMLRIGLVNEVVPPDRLMPAAMAMANELKKGAPLAVQMCKQLMYMGLDRSVHEHVQATRHCFSVANQTEDYKEGVRSFLEKREPRWVGR